MSPRELFRSNAFRIALTFSVVVALLTAGTFAIIYNQVANADVGRLRAVMADEAHAAARGDDAALRQALALRLTHDFRRMDYVGLYDAGGALVFGNLPTRPAIPVDGKSHYVASYVGGPDSAGEAEPVLFVAMARADGGIVVLGRNLQELFTLRMAVARALAIAIAPTALAALAAGVFFSRRMLKRLAEINGSIGSIVEGDLRARLPAEESGDDLDRVAGSVNGMLDEIERLLDQIASVGDNIAHDLRSPVASVRARLDTTLRAPDLPAKAAASVASAIRQLDRAMLTIDALLRVSSVEARRRRSAFQAMDLSAVCADAYEFFAPAAEAKGVAMSLRAPASTPMRGDFDLLREAVANIVDNAVKFTPPGGAVEIACAQVNGNPELAVSDTGCGVPIEDRERIFGRFYRARSDEPEEGWGIGLSIASMIARLHNFQLRVEDNHPGARFVMSGSVKAPLGLTPHPPGGRKPGFWRRFCRGGSGPVAA